MDQRQELLKRTYYDLDSLGSFGGAKRLFDVVKRNNPSIELTDVKDWLKSQDAYTNFRPKRIKFERVTINVDRVDEQWQADLMDMSFWSKQNNGIKYILVAIYVLSRYA